MRLARLIVGATALAVVAGAPGSATATAVAPTATAPIVTRTIQQMLEQAVPLKPISTGYNPARFVTTAQWAKKDARGCDLRDRLLIRSAAVPPRVSAGCRITGGVWLADGGTARITDHRKVRVATLQSLRTAWGVGSFAWTAQQRYAWARSMHP